MLDASPIKIYETWSYLYSKGDEFLRHVTVTSATAGGTARVSALVFSERSPRPACVMATAVQEYALLLLRPLATTTSEFARTHSLVFEKRTAARISIYFFFKQKGTKNKVLKKTSQNFKSHFVYRLQSPTFTLF